MTHVAADAAQRMAERAAAIGLQRVRGHRPQEAGRPRQHVLDGRFADHRPLRGFRGSLSPFGAPHTLILGLRPGFVPRCTPAGPETLSGGMPSVSIGAAAVRRKLSGPPAGPGGGADRLAVRVQRLGQRLALHGGRYGWRALRCLFAVRLPARRWAGLPADAGPVARAAAGRDCTGRPVPLSAHAVGRPDRTAGHRAHD